MKNKRYNELINAWNPQVVIYIDYKTKHSTGKMMMSVKFFLEFNNRIIKLFKGCQIVNVTIRDDVHGITIETFDDLFNTWLYCLGEQRI